MFHSYKKKKEYNNCMR